MRGDYFCTNGSNRAGSPCNTAAISSASLGSIGADYAKGDGIAKAESHRANGGIG